MSPETCSLGLVDEGVEGVLQRGEPQAVVDQLAPALLDAALEPREVALDGDVLQLLVRGDQRDRARRLVDLAALDADEPVLDHVEPADALGAGAAVELLDRPASSVTGRPSIATGTPSVEGDDDLVGLARDCDGSAV